MTLETLSQNALDQDVPLSADFYARMHSEAERYAALRLRRHRRAFRLRLLSGVAAGIVVMLGVTLALLPKNEPMTSEKLTVGIMNLMSYPDFVLSDADFAESLLAFQELPEQFMYQSDALN